MVKHLMVLHSFHGIKGQRLIWDVTCVDTLADSYIRKTSITAGSAAEEASKRKNCKYQNLKSANYIFKALAFETLGPWSLECKTFIDFIGAKLMIESGDSTTKFFFYQRISLAIRRGNAASILGTLPYVTPLEEVFMIYMYTFNYYLFIKFYYNIVY
jgi:hypothetical protein